MEIEVFYRYEHKYIINEDIYEKLRLRAYGVPKADGTVYLEIKKKYMGLVNKRRTPLSLAEAYRFAENGKVPIKSRGLNRQVAGQIAYFLSVCRPVPRLYFPMSARRFLKKATTFAFRLTRAFSHEGTIFFRSPARTASRPRERARC